MFRNRLLQILLMPISLLYGIGVSLRNGLYKLGILRSNRFSIPVISVGNLVIGGAGKSPHIEYLIQLLKDYINVSTLSRGYKRKTRGFRMVRANDRFENSGDEPLQIKRKFPDIPVAVAESRSLGIPALVGQHPQIQLVLLDDAFQHLSVQPDLNILLTEFDALFTDDYLLPSGRLREWRSAYKRADLIIVTKCPQDLPSEKRSEIIKKINPQAHQEVFFSNYQYFNPYYIFNPNYRIKLEEDVDVVLVSAIANTSYLLKYVEANANRVRSVEFEDHHEYTNYNVSRIFEIFKNIDSKKKLILTTEKDAVRFEKHRKYLLENKIPLFILPVAVNFLNEDSAKFDNKIKDFLLDYKV